MAEDSRHCSVDGFGILNITNYIFYTEYPISFYFDSGRNIQDAIEILRIHLQNAINNTGILCSQIMP